MEEILGRHAKGIEDTRAALVAAAWELFGRNGYATTTVETIIGKTGVSKGAFYHHFSSKEDILDAVAEQMTRSSWVPVQVVVEDMRLSAVEKVGLFLDALRSWRLSNLGLVGEVGQALYEPQNLLLLAKARDRTLRIAIPALSAVIRQGVEEGCFKVRDPETAASMILQLSAASAEDMMHLLSAADASESLVGRIERMLDLLLDAFERLLRAQEGSFRRPDPAVVERLCRRFARGERSAQ